jgi:hypothetical protein
VRHLKRLEKFEHTDTPAYAMLASPPLRPARPRSREVR